MMEDDLRDDINEIEKQIRGYLEELQRSTTEGDGDVHHRDHRDHRGRGRFGGAVRIPEHAPLARAATEAVRPKT
jgi:hypothetical protein